MVMYIQNKSLWDDKNKINIIYFGSYTANSLEWMVFLLRLFDTAQF